MTVERSPSAMDSETEIQTTFPSDQFSDDELMTSINQGQHVEESLSIIQRRYGSQVRQLIRSIVRDEWLAQDVAQETFLRVYQARHRYRAERPFATYLFHVARNICCASWVE